MSIQFCICPQNTVPLCSKFLLQWLFFPFAVHLRDQRERWQGGSGKRDVRRGVRRPGPEQSSAHRHQGNPRERQHVRRKNKPDLFQLFSFIMIQNCSVVLLNAELQFRRRMWFSVHALMGKDLAEMLLLLIPRALQRPHCVYSSFSGL